MARPDPQGEKQPFVRLVSSVFARVLPALGLVYLVLQVLDWVYGIRIFGGWGLLGLAVIIGICAIIASLWVLTATGWHLPTPGGRADDQLLGVRTAFRDRRWEEVLRIAGGLSRPLWVSGKLHLRLELGKMVEQAAFQLERWEQQTIALIDDMGWTSFVLGMIDQAKEAVHRGITIAQEHQLFHLVHKGHRHLAGMAVALNNIGEAEDQLQQAEQWLERVEDPRKKEELLVGLRCARADVDLKAKRFKQALAEFDEILSLYRNLKDMEREVKLYHRRGAALIGLGRIAEAKETFRKGLRIADQISRMNEVLENTTGLAQVAEIERKPAEAKRHFLTSANLAETMGLDALAKQLRTQARMAKRKVREEFSCQN